MIRASLERKLKGTALNKHQKFVVGLGRGIRGGDCTMLRFKGRVEAFR